LPGSANGFSGTNDPAGIDFATEMVVFGSFSDERLSHVVAAETGRAQAVATQTKTTDRERTGVNDRDMPEPSFEDWVSSLGLEGRIIAEIDV